LINPNRFPQGLAVRSLSAPVIYDNLVYYGVSSGEIIAVSLASGKLEWRYNPDYSDSRFHDIVGEMVIINNKLLITRYDGLIAAISLVGSARGLLWSQKISAIATSVFRDGRFFVGSVNGDISAYQVADGKRLWRTVTGASVGHITPGEQNLYVAGSNGRITAIDSSSGRINWHDDLAGSIASPPLYFAGGIFFATGLKNLYGYRIR